MLEPNFEEADGLGISDAFRARLEGVAKSTSTGFDILGFSNEIYLFKFEL